MVNSVGMSVKTMVMSASTVGLVGEYPGDNTLRAGEVGEYVGEVGHDHDRRAVM